MPFRIPNNTSWPVTIPDASVDEVGVMTPEQVAKLNQLPTPLPQTFDYIIVGYGTAGCALAKFLSDDNTKSVLVLESGQNYTADPNVSQGLPQSNVNVLSFKYTYEYRSTFVTPTPNPVTVNPGNPPGYSSIGDDQSERPLTYPAGRMWGGGSSHNYLQAVRGTPDTYDTYWQAAGGAQWSYSNLLPIMKWMEQYTQAFDSPYTINTNERGIAATAPIKITQNPYDYAAVPLDPANPFVVAWNGAASSNFVSDYNDNANGGAIPAPNGPGNCIAAGESYIDPLTGLRSSSSTGFAPSTVITPAGQGVGGRQLTVLNGANVDKVLIDYTPTGLRAVGVRFTLEGESSQVYDVSATTKVFLCAGSVVDPCILQRSGVGPASLLNGLNIPVLVDNPNVGANAENHPGGEVYLPVPAAAGATPTLPWTMFTDARFPPDGEVHDGVRRVQAFCFTAPLIAQIVGGYLTKTIIGLSGLSTAPGFIFGVPFVNVLTFGLETSNTGNVTITSTDPTYTPQINQNCYPNPLSFAPPDPTEQNALDIMVQTLKLIGQACWDWHLATDGAGLLPVMPPASYWPNTVSGGTAPDDSLLRQWLYDVSFVTAHICGTCRMSPDASTGVVDGNLDVHGVAGLAVVSNSSVPTIIKGNTAYSAYLMGLKKAQIEGAVVPW